MTFLTLQSLVRTYVQESSTTPLTLAVLKDLINEGQERTAELAEYSTATFTVTGGLVLNQYDYSYAGTLISILAVATVDSSLNLVPLEGPLSVQQMDGDFPSWRTDTADRPLRWWSNYNAIWIHPKSSATYAGTALEIRGTRWPPDMSADGDTPTDLPSGFHRMLAKYAAGTWLAIDRENPTAQRMSVYWLNSWQADVTRLRGLIWGRSKTDGVGLRIERSRDNDTSVSLVDSEDP